MEVDLVIHRRFSDYFEGKFGTVRNHVLKLVWRADYALELIA